MNWLEALSQTYDNCAARVGDPNEKHPLEPLCHATRNAHITVTIDGNGNFLRAKVIPKNKNELSTLIPCTEDSDNRTANIAPHPLCDNLKYLARDPVDSDDFFTKTTSAPVRNPAYETYCEQLEKWCESPYAHPKVMAVYTYVKKGTLIADLVSEKILPMESDRKQLIEKRNKNKEETFQNILKDYYKEGTVPAIFKSLPTGDPLALDKAFIRWEVEIDGETESRLWEIPALRENWKNYYGSTQTSKGMCYVTGEINILADKHPANLRRAGDKAKLISANDGIGFTFRGRFTSANQACNVGFETSQKAHNALRWLIARQGWRNGDQAIVAWALTGDSIPPILESTFKLFAEDDETPAANKVDGYSSAGQEYALRLNAKLNGYRKDINDTQSILVMGLDSATSGRMSISYYREMAASELFKKLERWHSECAWFQNVGKNSEFVGAPAPEQICQCAYGKRVDKKLIAATVRRLLDCIIDAVAIPNDIVQNCIRSVCARQAFKREKWEKAPAPPCEWEKALGIACALYRKQQTDLNRHRHSMSLETDRNTRSYLYGRLLAIADAIESAALKAAGESRDTNAARFMQRFAEHPYQTWRQIELSLAPYLSRLKAKKPGLLVNFEKSLQEVMAAFKADEFVKETPLEGEFLLAYHCQQKARWDGDTEIEA